MIAVVDYGLGNVLAFTNIFRSLNIDAIAARRPEELETATKIVLPGVGSFDNAINRLDSSGMRASLEQCVLERRVPVLGVCVGMQILSNGSEEGTCSGLGWIKGRVRAFRSQPGFRMPVPHMGWNDAEARAGGEGLFKRLTTARFYFLHSYFLECEEDENVAAVSQYGFEFPCAVRSGHIFGVQFHPEKSHQMGTQLLVNFARMQNA